MAEFIQVYDKICEVIFLFAAVLAGNIKSQKHKHWYLIFIAALVSVSTAHYFLYDHIKARSSLSMQAGTNLVLFALAAAASLLCFKSNVSDLLFKTALAWCVFRLCYSFPVLLVQTFAAFIYNFELNFLTLGYWLYKLSIAVTILALYGFIITRRKTAFIFSKVTPWIIIAIFIIEMFVRVLSAYFFEIFHISNQYKLITSFCEVVIYLLCAILLFVIAHALHAQRVNEDISRLMKAQSDYYEKSKNNIEAINVKCHDLKHQIAALRTGVGGSDFLSSLDDIEKSVMIYDSIAKTGNEPLDVLLTEKSLQCEQKSIKLTYMADGDCLDFIRPVDIYSLFGNVFDNAIESVDKLPLDKTRNISMNIFRWGKFIRIIVENTFCGDINIVDGVILSTKENKESHGYGIKSIRHIAEKYGGSVDISTNDNIFRLSIILPSQNLS